MEFSTEKELKPLSDVGMIISDVSPLEEVPLFSKNRNVLFVDTIQFILSIKPELKKKTSLEALGQNLICAENEEVHRANPDTADMLKVLQKLVPDGEDLLSKLRHFVKTSTTGVFLAGKLAQ